MRLTFIYIQIWKWIVRIILIFNDFNFFQIRQFFIFLRILFLIRIIINFQISKLVFILNFRIILNCKTIIWSTRMGERILFKNLNFLNLIIFLFININYIQFLYLRRIIFWIDFNYQFVNILNNFLILINFLIQILKLRRKCLLEFIHILFKNWFLEQFLDIKLLELLIILETWLWVSWSLSALRI